MNYFYEVKDKHFIPRVHPLLLSLTRVIKASEISPNIDSISEDDSDPRVLGNKYYTSPENFPSLDVHLYGINGMSQYYDAAKDSHLRKQPTAKNVSHINV
jgi:hypothetical protein